MPTIKEIIEGYLEEKSYDGLFNGDGQCACVKGDLFPCVDYFANCEPGYRGPCTCGEGCPDGDIYRVNCLPCERCGKLCPPGDIVCIECGDALEAGAIL